MVVLEGMWTTAALRGLAGYVGSIGVDLLFREEHRRPWVECLVYAVEGSGPPRVLYREDGYVRHSRERLIRGVSMSLVWGAESGGFARRGSGRVSRNCG